MKMTEAEETSFLSVDVERHVSCRYGLAASSD